jgi:RNA polymerase sigma-70 factor (ECF subfamily)
VARGALPGRTAKRAATFVALERPYRDARDAGSPEPPVNAALESPVRPACGTAPGARPPSLSHNVRMPPRDDPPRTVTIDSDDDAIVAVRLAALYGDLRRSLLAFLRKHTGDAQVAEDLLHDVVLKALTAARREAGAPQNLTGWLYAVARNAAMDHHRRLRPSEALPEDLQAPGVDEEDAALAELSGCLRTVAEALPETYRATLIAAEFDGLPLAEVARRHGLSLTAVKTRASRGRRLLQQQLVACCRVTLSPEGRVLDYDAREAAKCAPATPGCGTRGDCAH